MARPVLDNLLPFLLGNRDFVGCGTSGGKLLGRDHYPDCYSLFLAGGGVKGGYTHGETDELGFSVARDKVHVHDLHATILHLLGLDHEKLTYRHGGRDYRLTDVSGVVVKPILV